MRRVKYIDVAKLLAILVVMIDHIQYYVPGLTENRDFMQWRGWFASFFLQVFFMCTGLLVSSRNDESFVMFIKKRTRQIVVPYILWAMIYAFVPFDINTWKGILLGTNISLEQAGVNSVLWFLPAFFVANIVFWLIVRKINKMHLVILTGILLGVCGFYLGRIQTNVIPWGADIALVGVLLMVIGYSLRRFFEYVYKQSTMRKIILTLVLFFVSVGLAFYNMPLDKNSLTYTFAVWLARGLYGRSFILFILSSTVSSSFIICLSMLLERCKLLCQYGRFTLTMMTTHIVIYSLLSPYIMKFTETVLKRESRGGGGLCALILFVSTLIVMYPLLMFIDRVMPNLSG